jgi:hypothetical protein
MPKYRVRDPRSNRTVVLTGDAPPTEQELHQIFATLNAEPRQAPERTWADTAVDALPTVAGAAGGIIGGIGGTAFGMGVGGVPGAVGGAALGGATGEALRQLVNRARGAEAPATPLAAAKAIGTEGAVQGATEVAGAGLGGVAKVAGKALVENAVRPTMSLVREFPDVINTIVKERLPVGRSLPGVAKGSEQALAKLGEASRGVRELLAKADAAGTTFEASSLIQKPILELVDDIARQPLGDAQERQLGGMLDEFLRRNHGPLTPTAVKELKARAQAIAKPVYRAVEKGFPVTAEQSLNARFNAAVGTGAKESLETIAGVGEGEARKKSLIGATRALKQAENRRLSLAGELGSAALGGAVGTAVTSLLGAGGGAEDSLKNGVTGWLVARGIASPRSLSRGGLVLTSRQAQALLREFPRLADYVVREKGTPADQGLAP